MTKSNLYKKTTPFAAAAAVATGLVLFMLISIPNISGLRFLILAAGFVVIAVTLIRPLWGLAAFFAFLLTANNWPYYFGLQHNMLYVHVAVILFGFMATGWWIRRGIDRGRKAETTDEKPVDAGANSVSRPLCLLASLVAVSAAVTAWRWLNFFPLRGDRVYEWMTNTNGLPANAARLSVLISALSYIVPFALFGIAVRTIKNRRDLDLILRVVGIAFLGAVLFGFVQYFAVPELGNTKFWIFLKQINATFKDPNAFGGVLSILLPILFGALLSRREKNRDSARNEGQDRRGDPECGLGDGWWRIVWVAGFILGILVFPLIGARSALLGFGAGMVVLLGLAFRHRIEKIKTAETTNLNAARAGSGKGRRNRKRWIPMIAAVVLIAIVGGGLFVRSRLYERFAVNVREVAATGDLLRLSPERYFLWRHALAMTRDYPLAGVGVGAFLVELPDYYAKDKAPIPPGFEGYKRVDSAENHFLQAAAELGLIGLIVLLAVFAGLVREIGRGIKSGVLTGADRWLFLGALGGLVGFSVNALFHSFAQSFETLFFFWFAAVVIVVLRSASEASARDKMLPRTPTEKESAEGSTNLLPRVIFLLIIVLFGAGHLWNSSHSLSMAAKTTAFGIGQEFGLYQIEQDEAGRTFRWTRAEAAWTIEVHGRFIRIPMMVSHPNLKNNPVQVKFTLVKDLFREARVLGSIKITEGGWKTWEFEIPLDFSGKMVILVNVDRTWSPREVLGSRDARRLGVAVGTVDFRD